MQNNEELAELFAQDQVDRKAESIDWAVVEPRDRVREARVKELYNSGSLQTGADYYHAAMILQHGVLPDDYLLAHEFCIVAIGIGEERAKWQAAATKRSLPHEYRSSSTIWYTVLQHRIRSTNETL